jgi:hypothetical protein
MFYKDKNVILEGKKKDDSFCFWFDNYADHIGSDSHAYIKNCLSRKVIEDFILRSNEKAPQADLIVKAIWHGKDIKEKLSEFLGIDPSQLTINVII